MFEKNKLWMALAAATLVAACGGSSGGGGGGGDDDDDDDRTPVEESTLQSYLNIQSDQMVVNRLVPIEAYTSETLEGEPAGGIYGQDVGTGDNGAPFRTFGLRIDNVAQAIEGSTVAEETATGRLAISLTERAATVADGEQAESMQIMLTGVTLSTNAEGVVSASVAEGATMFVSGQPATGGAVSNIDVAIPAGAIGVVQATGLDGGETAQADDVALVFNLDAIFANADEADAAELTKFAPLSGRFDMNFALSAADVYRDGVLLDAQSISVTGNNMEAVEGSGIEGNIWIQMERN